MSWLHYGCQCNPDTSAGGSSADLAVIGDEAIDLGLHIAELCVHSRAEGQVGVQHELAQGIHQAQVAHLNITVLTKISTRARVLHPCRTEQTAKLLDIEEHVCCISRNLH